MKNTTQFILFLAFLVLASCQTGQKPLNITSSEELELAVDSLLSTEVSPNEPGAAVLVAYDGEMLVGKGYGLSNYSGQVPVRPTTNFRMGSVSKQFTALCILKLFDLKLLFPSQDVGQILSAKTLEGVKVEHLLHHTSGIPDYDGAFSDWNRPEVPQNEDILDWYRLNGTPEFDPGSQFRYSNGGYNLLATIVEKVTGEQFEQFATQQVFYSNGMLTSLYYNLGKPVEIFNRAYCYEKKDGDWSQVDGNLLNGLIGEGGVYTSVRDYFQYDRQLRMGRALDGDAENLIFTPGDVEIGDLSDEFEFLEPGKAGYAAGWFVQGDKAFHGGMWYGVSTMVVHDLSRPLTIAIFRNTNEPLDDLINGLYKIADSYVNYIEKEGKYGN
jgi:CubicO group peptidase (beta-lactamase class C family)